MDVLFQGSLLALSFLSGKGKRTPMAAGFNVDRRMEYLRLNDLIRRSNRKRHLDLVFDLYGPPSNLYRCDSEPGLPQYRRSLIEPIFELNIKRNRMGLSV